METPFLHSPRPMEVQSLGTDDLRRSMLVENLFSDSKIHWQFTDLDRLAVGGVKPVSPVQLSPLKQTGTEFFLQRRELGMINIGGPGKVTADGKTFELANLDCLYIGMGTRSVEFASNDA